LSIFVCIAAMLCDLLVGLFNGLHVYMSSSEQMQDQSS
jgi:hypothetical protein